MLHVSLAVFACASVLPFYWLVCGAFQRGDGVLSFRLAPWLEPSSLTLDNFRALLHETPFARWLFNSIFLASAHTVLVVGLSSIGGFALAKYEFRGKRLLMLVMLLTMLVPSQVILPGLYELIWRIRWVDTYAAILVPGAVSVFGMFLFRQAMLSVPDELLDAARVDGSSELRLWWSVVLPVVRPMTGAFTLMSFLASWNSFLWPQVVLQDEQKYTLPIGLANLMGLPEHQAHLGLLMAGTLLGVLPVIALFAALQRDFVGGLASGAVKG
ncbi:MAG: carbohydrate ABC transporter permease [Tepidisphaeraceae bacterium]